MFHPQFVFQFGLSWNKISKRFQKVVTGPIIDLFMYFLGLVISIQIISHELVIMISRFTFCRKTFYAYYFSSFVMSKTYHKIKRHEIYKWFSNKFQNIHCRKVNFRYLHTSSHFLCFCHNIRNRTSSKKQGRINIRFYYPASS